MSQSQFLPTDIALVTGASSGIGYEIAKALDRFGIQEIILVARRRERLEALVKELSGKGTIYCCDLSNEEERHRLLKQIPAIDILVNNAGFGRRGLFAAQERALYTQMIALHATATVELCHHVIPSMRQKQRGFIINVGSSIGEFSVPGSALYCATKAFINNFTESLRMEEQINGINTMLLAPGPVTTEFFSVSQPGRQTPKGALNAQFVAQNSLEALLRGAARHMPDWKIRLLVTAARHLPRAMCYSLIHQIHRLKNNV